LDPHCLQSAVATSRDFSAATLPPAGIRGREGFCERYRFLVRRPGMMTAQAAGSNGIRSSVAGISSVFSFEYLSEKPPHIGEQ
jgi:hypothetical protein